MKRPLVEVDCPDCEGSGKWRSTFSGNEYDCDTCGGDGTLEPPDPRDNPDAYDNAGNR